MKLLFDANLSPALASILTDLYPGSTHVFWHGEIAADDAAIWSLAGREDYLIVTKDTDFLDLSLLHGGPPKVILISVGNSPTARIEALLRAHVRGIRRFAEDAEQAVFIIDR